MNIEYGIDCSTWSGKGLPDLDPYFTIITGNDLLAQVIIRRTFCTHGSYIDSPNYGINLFNYLNKKDSQITPGSIAAQIRSQVLADERFDDCKAVVKYVNGSLNITIYAKPSQSPPFSLTMSLSAATDPNNFQIVFRQSSGT